jgi:demethylmenaquinone methyltransferase / 2-methoxy-6-polyprenyl-1,4-benzoquinol methylase
MSTAMPSVEKKRVFVKNMFARIASRYDLMNKIMTFGQDAAWRRKAVKKLQPENHNCYLDLGAGTGDLSQEIIRQAPEAQVVAADLTLEMILVGKEKGLNSSIFWIAADAQALPFPAKTFSGVVSGYLLRNVPDIDASLMEQVRVLRPNAALVSLDTTPPVKNVFYPFILFYLRWMIPLMGKIITGDSQAYAYLPESTRKHTPVKVLAEKMRHSGLDSISYETLMLGTMAIHDGQKPD